MTLDEAIRTLTTLPVADRLRLAEALWDSLAEDEIPGVTEVQRAELDRRLRDHDADPTTALTREEVERQLEALR